jgi:endonuclease YncB( thermonuclease family)
MTWRAVKRKLPPKWGIDDRNHLAGKLLSQRRQGQEQRHRQHHRPQRTAAEALLFLLALSITPALAEEYAGKVVGITDGDTLALLTPEKRQLKVRLAEIDTPEHNQPYGSRARQALSDLAFGREARVVVVDHDRYGRVVGRVFIDETDVNAELVRQGAAWVYRDFARDRTLFALEDEARAAKRGLWALPEAQRTPPWEWRQASRAAKPQVSSTEQAALSCGAKRTCKQMQDCAEARFYLDTCGLTRLDGDGDGVPCEALCR